MNRTISNVFAIIVGAFLLIEGVWGEVSDTVFGALSTNRIHATIHILLGIVGIYTGLKGGSRGFLIFLGAFDVDGLQISFQSTTFRLKKGIFMPFLLQNESHPEN